MTLFFEIAMSSGNVYYSSLSRFYEKIWNGANGKGSPGGSIQWNIYDCTVKVASMDPSVKYGECQSLGQYGTTYAPDFNIYSTFSSNDQLTLLSNLSEQIRGHSFNLGVAIGEGSQTIKLVEDTVVRLFKSIRFLKKGRIDLAVRALGVSPTRRHSRNQSASLGRLRSNTFRSKAGRDSGPQLTTQDVSAMWLEIQYGWKPLISDVYESANAFAALQQKNRKTRYSASKSGSVVSTTYSVAYGGLVECKSVSTRKIIYELTEVSSAGRQLGLLNPLSVAWELVPFSFVADWFIPIGTYLDNIAQYPDLNGRFLYSDKQKMTGTIRKDPSIFKDAPSWPLCLLHGANTKMLSVRFSRSVAFGRPVVPLPEFKALPKALSSGHIWNAVALLYSGIRF